MSMLSARLNANAVDFPAPHRSLRACVVIPVRNEQAVLPGVIAALAAYGGQTVRNDVNPERPDHADALEVRD